MGEETELDLKANEWLNSLIPKLRYKQDYFLYHGDSEDMIEDGKKVGIIITGPDVRFYPTGITKLYRLLVDKEDWPDEEYTEQEEKEFTEDYEARYPSKLVKGRE